MSVYSDMSEFPADMYAYYTASLWPEERKKLVELASKSDAPYVMELGVLRGETTRYLAENTDKIIIAIDPFKMTDNDNDEIRVAFYQNCQSYIDQGRIVHIQEYSDDAHRYFTAEMVNNCALIFIDYDGNGEDHYRDIQRYMPYVATDGTVAIHDFFDEGTLNKRSHINYAIERYSRHVNRPMVWYSMQYYPKYQDVQQTMGFFNTDPMVFYANRSRGLVWSSFADQ